MNIFDSWLINKYIAHRGLHNENIPENSLPAFQNAIEHGYAIEIDVQQLKDGEIVVFHDDTMSRMTGEDGFLANFTLEEIKNLRLTKSKEKIPTLKEVLNLVDGKTEILIEIKNTGKVGKFESDLLKILNEYKGSFAIQSFNPYVLKWFKENAPDILRGQLSCYFKKEKLKFYKKFVLKRLLLNKISDPDFISYKGSELPNMYVRRYAALPLLAWTIRSQKEYIDVIKYCDNIIFENFEPKI